ncbi:hypothetical protein LshimejAT787_0304000 [Lyophyllum shimeji]|uniref:Uncharacterized protein n=1 Tax=Lyophyllum shimeji TaxID=47721 RepID=A0A9P3PHC8_LYOSH|nr:hypothetical protein LshimejAT787_0304000 [Lyophyllum shimeji]
MNRISYSKLSQLRLLLPRHVVLLAVTGGGRAPGVSLSHWQVLGLECSVPRRMHGWSRERHHLGTSARDAGSSTKSKGQS